MNRLAALLLAALVLLSCGTATAADAARRGAPFQEGIELASSVEGLEQGDVSTSFSLLELRDLWIRVKVARMAHTALLTLTFTTPRGEVFYETRQLYTREPHATQVRIPSVRHPVTAFPAKRLHGGVALDQPIPIGAGVFMRYPQAGTWLVQATLDGQRTLSARMDLSVAP